MQSLNPEFLDIIFKENLIYATIDSKFALEFFAL